MASRIKLIVICNLLWSEFVETNATVRSASTDLDHALVVCDLTQIPAEGSGPSSAHPDPSAGIWVKSKTCVTKICRSKSKRRIRFNKLAPK